MSDSRPDPSKASADLRQQLSRKRTDLDSNATFLTFEPGLYAIDFRSASASMSDVGLPLPCARLEPVAMPASPGRAFVSMTPEGGWLSRSTAAAHVLVVGGRAGAVLTIYRPTDGTPMPEVHFRSVVTGPAPVATANPQNAAQASAQTAAQTPAARIPDGALTLTVHVEGHGDRTAAAGVWGGDTGGQRSIEGFSISLPAGMSASDLEYQGIMGEDWRTPWIEAGAFCGSRGLQLPLLGFRLRLVGEAADRFDCRAHGHFARRGVVGPVSSGEDCHADSMPLTAMMLEITPKAAAELPATDAAAPSASGLFKKSRVRRPSKP